MELIAGGSVINGGTQSSLILFIKKNSRQVYSNSSLFYPYSYLITTLLLSPCVIFQCYYLSLDISVHNTLFHPKLKCILSGQSEGDGKSEGGNEGDGDGEVEAEAEGDGEGETYVNAVVECTVQCIDIVHL